MDRQGRNIFTLLVVSLTLCLTAFQAQPPAESSELHYDYFLWCTLILALIAFRDLLDVKLGSVPDDRQDGSDGRRPFATFIAFLLIGNAVVRLYGWRLVEGFSSPTIREADMAEAGSMAVLLFILSAVLLFAIDQPARLKWARGARVAGCIYMLILPALSWGLTLGLHHVLHFPDLMVNKSIVFVGTLAILMLLREFPRWLRT